MDELYKHIDKWDGGRTYLYSVIFVIILWFFSKKTIGINILVAIIVGAFVINYMNNRTQNMMDTQKDILDTKIATIQPKINEETKKQRPIIDVMFSIQDMYSYNPLQYEEVIRNINQFYDKYKLSFVDSKTSHINYDLMKQYKRDALNALMSLIHTIPEDKRYIDKLNNSTIVLDGIMTKHLDQISFLIDEDIYKRGYNIDTKNIDYGPKSFNEYDDMFKNYSYEIY